MLDQVLKTFDVESEYDLSIMKDRQTLFDVITNILEKIKEVFEKEKSDVVLVHGTLQLHSERLWHAFTCK